ncbi:MAG: polysaccharide biosynthesis tyrosine autokinase [Candidatus Omnitrophica bacterium]|nr:polysaccharide biosynthesis tyrosine autokinase [Candidatus Omnitrophota bacterium]
MVVPLSQQEVHLREYFYILRKRRWLFLFFFLSMISLSFIFTAMEKVLYRSTTTILVERESPNIVDFTEVVTMDASTSEYYQTQYEMLKSRSLIERLVRKENLEQDPYLNRLRKGGIRQRLHQFLKDQKLLTKWLDEFLGKRSLADVFVRRMLEVEPVRNTRLVKISIKHPVAVRTAEIANSLVDLFIQQNLENRFLVSNQVTELISGQLVEMKEKVSDAEKKLQEYKENNKLITIPSIHEKDKFIQDAKLELVKLQAEEARLSARYLPAHPKRIHIRSQIQSLEGKINEELEETLELSRKAVDYDQLVREAEGARKTYEALLARLEETDSQAKMQASNILIVDRAQVPVRPYKPQPFTNFIVAFCFGLMGAVFFAFFFEYLDSTVKIPDDIEKGLGMELLGIIPDATETEKKDASKGELYVLNGPHTPTAESFRALRTALLFRLRHLPSACSVILVTSPNPEEGKTTVALNLATVFHQNKLKTLLIESDLRKPRLYKFLGVPQEKGLSEILEGNLREQDTIHKNIDQVGFDFLSCGVHSPHPTEILGSSAMRHLLERLRLTYDIVIIDSPPYHPVADVAVLSDYAEAIVIVARYQKTDKRHLRDIKRRFSQEGNKIIGIVINRVSVRERDYYYHQYYYYGYGDESGKK